MDALKFAVQDFWDAASCGEIDAVGDSLEAQFTAHAEARYALEPYIRDRYLRPPTARAPGRGGTRSARVGAWPGTSGRPVSPAR